MSSRRTNRPRTRPPIAVERRRIRRRRRTHRQPAPTAGPVRVARIRTPAPVRVEVQVRTQFVTPTTAGPRTADPVPPGTGKRRPVRSRSRPRRNPVAVQVVPHRIELRQRVHPEQTVPVGVVDHRHRELLRRRPVRATRVGRRHPHHRRPHRHPGHPHCAPRPARTAGHVRRRRLGRIRQRIPVRVPETPAPRRPAASRPPPASSPPAAPPRPAPGCARRHHHHHHHHRRHRRRPDRLSRSRPSVCVAGVFEPSTSITVTVSVAVPRVRGATRSVEPVIAATATATFDEVAP